MHELTQS